MPISVLVDKSTGHGQDLAWCDASEYSWVCPGDRVTIECRYATLSATVLTVERTTVAELSRVTSVLWHRDVNDPISYHACVSITGVGSCSRWCTLDHRMLPVRIGTGVMVYDQRTGVSRSGTVIALGRPTVTDVHYAVTAVSIDAAIHNVPRGEPTVAVDVRLDSGGWGTFDARLVPGWEFREGDRVTIDSGGSISYGSVSSWRPVLNLASATAAITSVARNDGRADDVRGVRVLFCDVVFAYSRGSADPSNVASYLYSTGRFRDLQVGDRVRVETQHGHALAEVVRVMAERPLSGYQGDLKEVVAVESRGRQEQGRLERWRPEHPNCRCDPGTLIKIKVEQIKTKRRILP